MFNDPTYSNPASPNQSIPTEHFSDVFKLAALEVGHNNLSNLLVNTFND